MGRKARILLVLLSVTLALAISGTFHHCYVIESLRPDPRDNTPPAVVFESVIPELYYDVSVTIPVPEGEEPYLNFSIPEIYDPDPETMLYAKFAIDYDGSGIATGGDFRITKSEAEEGQDQVWWEGSFSIEKSSTFITPAGSSATFRVIAAVSDRPWDVESDNYFAVPEDTVAAFVQWVIVVNRSE